MIDFKRFLLGLFTLMVVWSFTQAAENKVVISGRVLDAKNAAVPSVRVAVYELKRQVFTDTEGKFRFGKVPKGTYRFLIGRIGYKTIDTTITVNDDIALEFQVSESDIITSDVVVTGTRTYKHIENLPMPVEVVPQEEVRDQGYLRLDEVLAQEMGITMTEDRGRGMQIQGLDADYTLVLLNGEPMSGRTGGVLDITRFSIGDMSRIEVVRGPSSSLYGSSALAGVINLITEKPTKPLDVSLSGRYGSHSTYDVSAQVQSNLLDKKLGLRLFANNYRTEGFSLISSVIEQTVPQNNNWTVNGELFYDITSTVSSRLNGRYYSEEVENRYLIQQNNDSSIIKTNVSNDENNFSLKINHGISNHYDLEVRLYASDYKTETKDVFEESGDLYDSYKFRHKIGKAELQSTSLLGTHQLTGGFGAQFERAESAQIEGNGQNTQLYYAYLQDDWQISEKVGIIGSLRFDGHSDYTDNLSPKIAGSWQLVPGLYLRASFGSGFKAPTFEQLYLNWSLASEGYSVFGVKNFPEEFRKLSETGQIQDTLYNLDEIKDLKPEQSWALDFGGTYSFDDLFEVKLNIFRNNVNGLIEFLPVALKTNGRLVYTYFNLDKIFTQGLEMRLRVNPLDFLYVQFHYQLLFSGDFDVINTLKDPNQTEYWKRDGNDDRPVRLDEYGGLFFRSRHSGSVKLSFPIDDWGMLVSLRGTYKSKYGYADVNGNTILDDQSEYAPGYSLWYFVISKNLFDYFTLQLGVENMFDYTSEKIRLVTSGRTFYGRLIFNYNIF